MKKQLLIVFIFISSFGESQDLNLTFSPITVQSPNAASLGLFGQIPVDYSTGVPDISIPIYDLKEGNISIPIILRYHSSGVKPNHYPSWVGLNWTLQAGGCITRTVKGLPDENDNIVQTPTGIQELPDGNAGYFYNTALLSNDDWYMYNNTGGGNWFKDTEPDEFKYNFNGISGSFYLDHLGQWQVLSEHEIKVICTQENISSINFDYKYDGELQHPFDFGQMFTQFILITEDGTQYIFGGNRKSIEFTRDENLIGGSFRSPTATTWNLTKIIPPEGTNNSIDFEYVRDSIDLILYNFEPVSINETNLPGVCYSIEKRIGQNNSRLIEPSYLRSITSRNAKLIFSSEKYQALPLIIDQGLLTRIHRNYELVYQDINKNPFGTGYYFTKDLQHIGRKLTNIDINYNSPIENQLFKSFVFKYIEKEEERLKLDSLEEFSPVVSENHPIYSFEYYNDASSLLDYQNYQTTNIDHWGYFNNINSNQYLPTSGLSDFLHDQNRLDDYFNSRNPSQSSEVYNIDMLKKITYPTKGTSLFEYEPHTYSSQVERDPYLYYNPINGFTDLIMGLRGFKVKDLDLNNFAGGIRIKKITSSPINPTGLQTAKEYFYVNDFLFSDTPETLSTKLSSGQLQMEVSHPPDPDCVTNYTNCLTEYQQCVDECVALYHNDPNALQNCISYCPDCGSLNTCYSYSRYLRKGYIGNVGTFYYFQVNPDLPIIDDNGNHIRYHEVVEKNSDGGYNKFYYNIQNQNNTEVFDEIPIGNRGNSFYSYTTSKLLERNTINLMQVFDNAGNMVKKTTFFYNSESEKYLKKIRTRSFRDETLSCDNSSFIFLPEGTANYIYYFNNFLEKKVETDIFNNSEVNTTTTYTYDNVYDRIIKEITKTQSDGTLLINSIKYPFDYVQQSSSCNSGNCYTLYQMYLRNIIEPIESITVKKDDNKEVIIDGKLVLYNIFSLSIIKPEKLLSMDLNIPLDKSSFQAFHINSNTLQWDSHYSEKVKYNNYDTFGNLLEFQKTNNNPTCFLYSYNHSFPILKISNLTYSILESTYSNAGSLANEYHTQTDYLQKFDEIRNLFPDKLIESYTYDILTGITLSSDYNGINTYYVYDNLGRLKWIKDHHQNILKGYEYHYAGQ